MIFLQISFFLLSSIWSLSKKVSSRVLISCAHSFTSNVFDSFKDDNAFYNKSLYSIKVLISTSES